MKVDTQQSGTDERGPKGLGTSTPGTGELDELLARLDGAALLERVAKARRTQGPAEVIGGLVLPAVRSLHRRHRTGDIDAAALAAGTALAHRAILCAGQPVIHSRGATRRPVVVAAPATPGMLDAEGAYETLLATGHSAQLLVAVEDAHALGRHLRSLAPIAVVAPSGDPGTLPAIAALAATAGHAGVPVLAVGPAYGPDGARAARVGATAWAADPSAMLEFLDGWHATGGALAMNVEEPPEAAVVRAAWPAVVMAAAGTGGPDEGWAQATVRAVGEMLVASLWAADATVLLDWLDDELAGPDRTQVRDVHVVGLLDAVSSVLPPTMAVASAMVGDARDHLRQRILRPGRTTRPPVRPAPRGTRSDVDQAIAPLRAVGHPATIPPIGGPGDLSAAPVSSGSAATPAAGQAFADLLLLGALSAQSTGAALAVAQPGGRWSALAHGLDQRDGLNDSLLWSVIAGRSEPLEIPDLGVHSELSRSPLAQRPLSLRWAYGVALRDHDGVVIAVFCLLDRWLRQGTRREQRALTATARQLTAQLMEVRRPAAQQAAAAQLRPAWGQPRVTERPGAGRRGMSPPEGQQLLRSHEVAVLFDVTERTVINWAAASKLPSLRTIGGHLRFRSEDVYSLLSSRQAGG